MTARLFTLSLKNARLADGDIILVRKQPAVENGEVAVVLVSKEETTVKRFYQQNNQVILKPENEKSAPQVHALQDVKILGKVVRAIISI